MNVLYNGEYTDFDITTNPNWKDMLARQEEFYPQWEGKIYGDFEIVKIEWDWGEGHQRALLRCIHCGAEKYTNNPRAFRRGSGVGRKCDCQKPPRIEKPKKENIQYSAFVGEERNGFAVFKYNPRRGFLVCCVECGKEKWVTGKEFVNGNVTCNHKKTTVYGEELIGKEFGDLTVIEKRGAVYLCRCKCGFEKELEPTVFVRGYTKTCGRPECEFYTKRLGGGVAAKRRRAGLDFEHKLQDIFEQAGYEVTRTPDTGDYGVDFIAVINGEKWAFQCKKSKKPANVHSVLEAYAGGRFYDCTRFCVASPSGFTTNAQNCADKLGVQLETDRFRFNVPINENAAELLKTPKLFSPTKKEREWTVNGITKPVSEWCEEYNVSTKQISYRMSLGMTLAEALNYIRPKGRIMVEINGEIKPKKEWCEEFGISVQAYDYRVGTGKMTPYEALTTPLHQKKT